MKLIQDNVGDCIIVEHDDGTHHIYKYIQPMKVPDHLIPLEVFKTQHDLSDVGVGIMVKRFMIDIVDISGRKFVNPSSFNSKQVASE